MDPIHPNRLKKFFLMRFCVADTKFQKNFYVEQIKFCTVSDISETRQQEAQICLHFRIFYTTIDSTTLHRPKTFFSRI